MKVRSALRHMDASEAVMRDLAPLVDYAHRSQRKVTADAVVLGPTHVRIDGPSDLDGYIHIVVRWLFTSETLDREDAA